MGKEIMASVLSKKQNRYSLSELKTLGTQLLPSRAHVNNLPIRMGFTTPSSRPLHALESLICLRSFFTPLLPKLPPSSSSNDVSIQEDPELIYRTWLRSKFDEFVLSLIHFSVPPLSDETLMEEVVDSLMECVKDGNRGKFHSCLEKLVLCSCLEKLPTEKSSGISSSVNLEKKDFSFVIVYASLYSSTSVWFWLFLINHFCF